MLRVYFPKEKDRINFFNNVKNFGKRKSWKNVGKIIGTGRSMVEKYRSGEFCMPEERFSILINLLSEDKREHFSSLIKKKKNNWGQVIGGKKAYKINKKEFERGRKIAAKLNNNNPKYEFDINMDLSEDLCEFVGSIIGDGFTNKYNNMYQTQITGDKNLDADYYRKRLKPICEKLFNITPRIFEGQGGIRLNIYSKRLFEMLTKRFKIPAGKKCYTVKIPEEILNKGDNFLRATLIGMFDTDGGVGFDRRSKYKNPYVRVNYVSVSKDLMDQLHQILNNLSINHTIHKSHKKAFVIQINGKKNVGNFLTKIGFSNPRHLKKITHLLNPKELGCLAQ